MFIIVYFSLHCSFNLAALKHILLYFVLLLIALKIFCVL